MQTKRKKIKKQRIIRSDANFRGNKFRFSSPPRCGLASSPRVLDNSENGNGEKCHRGVYMVGFGGCWKKVAVAEWWKWPGILRSVLRRPVQRCGKNPKRTSHIQLARIEPVYGHRVVVIWWLELEQLGSARRARRGCDSGLPERFSRWRPRWLAAHLAWKTEIA